MVRRRPASPGQFDGLAGRYDGRRGPLDVRRAGCSTARRPGPPRRTSIAGRSDGHRGPLDGHRGPLDGLAAGLAASRLEARLHGGASTPCPAIAGRRTPSRAVRRPSRAARRPSRAARRPPRAVRSTSPAVRSTSPAVRSTSPAVRRAALSHGPRSGRRATALAKISERDPRPSQTSPTPSLPSPLREREGAAFAARSCSPLGSFPSPSPREGGGLGGGLRESTRSQTLTEDPAR